jgi:hypothetical protein
MHRRRLLIQLGITVFIAATVLAGTTGRITGIVKDSGGSLIPGVQLTVTNPVTGITVKAKTDKKGTYSFLTLSAGRYDLQAIADGFKPQSRPGLIVHVDSAIQIDLVLEPHEGKK